MQRFKFGKNWSEFLSVLNEERIAVAAQELSGKLGELRGKSFLDIGCGSGIHSLAAVRLGAARVHSFDYDADSVRCTQEVKRRYAPNADWLIEQGSALDKDYLLSLGKFDIVYSWGVLHHTGDMWKALDYVMLPLQGDGMLFISLYNDQGGASRRWAKVKQLYGSVPPALRPLYVATVMLWPELRSCRLKIWNYPQFWKQYYKQRGMSRWHDLVDWVGGYPFEVSTPDQIFRFFTDRGMTLKHLKTCGGGLGCNEFVFSMPTPMMASR